MKEGAGVEFIQNMDFAVLEFIQEKLRCGFLDTLMPIITHLGDKGIIWILTAVVLLFFKEYRRCGAILLFGLLAGLIVGNLIMKNIFERSRPCWLEPIANMLIAVPEDYSFPSGHTMSSAIAAAVLVLRDRRIGVPAVIIALSIAFSRLYLYVHFPTDVLVGAAVGVLIGIVAYRFGDRLMTGKTSCASDKEEIQAKNTEKS